MTRYYASLIGRFPEKLYEVDDKIDKAIWKLQNEESLSKLYKQIFNETIAGGVTFLEQYLNQRSLIDMLGGYDQNECFEKNTNISNSYRNWGNALFEEKQFNKAMLLYNISICYAKSNSLELSLAYGNRSAVYFQTKHYEECLADIKHIKKLQNHPKMAKILEREEKCLLEKQNTRKKTEDFNYKVELREGGHKNVPFVSKCLNKAQINSTSLIMNNKELLPGDIVAIERPVFYYIIKRFHYLACGNCLKGGPLIPCPHCPDVMFCNEQCMNEAWINFHEHECSVGTMLKMSLNYLDLMAVRLTIIAYKIFEGNLSELQNMLKNRDEFYGKTVFDENCVNFHRKQYYKMIFGQAAKFNDLCVQKRMRIILKSEYIKEICNKKSFFKSDNSKKLFNEVLIHHIMICEQSMKTVSTTSHSDGGMGSNFLLTIFPVQGRIRSTCFNCSNITEFFDGKKSYLIASKYIPEHNLLGGFTNVFCMKKPCMNCCTFDFFTITSYTAELTIAVLKKLSIERTKRNAFETFQWLKCQYQTGKCTKEEFANLDSSIILTIFDQLLDDFSYNIEELPTNGNSLHPLL